MLLILILSFVYFKNFSHRKLPIFQHFFIFRLQTSCTHVDIYRSHVLLLFAYFYEEALLGLIDSSQFNIGGH
jgi:hypothetical protein